MIAAIAFYTVLRSYPRDDRDQPTFRFILTICGADRLDVFRGEFPSLNQLTVRFASGLGTASSPSFEETGDFQVGESVLGYNTALVRSLIRVMGIRRRIAHRGEVTI
jgi:hypothetical protein